MCEFLEGKSRGNAGEFSVVKSGNFKNPENVSEYTDSKQDFFCPKLLLGHEKAEFYAESVAPRQCWG